jgi:hypothetical protein
MLTDGSMRILDATSGQRKLPCLKAALGRNTPHAACCSGQTDHYGDEPIRLNFGRLARHHDRIRHLQQIR